MRKTAKGEKLLVPVDSQQKNTPADARKSQNDSTNINGTNNSPANYRSGVGGN